MKTIQSFIILFILASCGSNKKPEHNNNIATETFGEMGELIVLFGLFIGGMFAVKALVGERAWAGMCEWGQHHLGMHDLDEESSQSVIERKDEEIADLKRRVETLERIVTDTQFDLKRQINDL